MAAERADRAELETRVEPIGLSHGRDVVAGEPADIDYLVGVEPLDLGIDLAAEDSMRVVAVNAVTELDEVRNLKAQLLEQLAAHAGLRVFTRLQSAAEQTPSADPV